MVTKSAAWVMSNKPSCVVVSCVVKKNRETGMTYIVVLVMVSVRAQVAMIDPNVCC